jgi:hypothetical protein
MVDGMLGKPGRGRDFLINRITKSDKEKPILG